MAASAAWGPITVNAKITTGSSKLRLSEVTTPRLGVALLLFLPASSAPSLVGGREEREGGGRARGGWGLKQERWPRVRSHFGGSSLSEAAR